MSEMTRVCSTIVMPDSMNFGLYAESFRQVKPRVIREEPGKAANEIFTQGLDQRRTFGPLLVFHPVGVTKLWSMVGTGNGQKLKYG